MHRLRRLHHDAAVTGYGREPEAVRPTRQTRNTEPTAGQKAARQRESASSGLIAYRISLTARRGELRMVMTGVASRPEDRFSG